jgi:hypothetical protein
MAGKEERQNRAQEAEPHTRGDRSPAKGSRTEVGEEKKYSNKAWSSERQKIGSTSKAHVGADLGSAVDELHSQHPIKHHELGPHHGKSHHDRHEPLHGLHPKSRHGR